MDGAPLFHRLHGQDLGRLPPAIARLHDVRGPRRALCGLLRFPPDGDRIDIAVAMEPAGRGETWRRDFGGHVMTTRLEPGPLPGTVSETLVPVTVVSRLAPDPTGVTHTLVGLRLFGLPMPRRLWPRLAVREAAHGARYTFSMSIAFPWGEPLVHYEGWLDIGQED